MNEIRELVRFLIPPAMIWGAGLLMRLNPALARDPLIRVPAPLSIFVGRSPFMETHVSLRQFCMQILMVMTVFAGFIAKYLFHIPDAYRLALVYGFLVVPAIGVSIFVVWKVIRQFRGRRNHK